MAHEHTRLAGHSHPSEWHNGLFACGGGGNCLYSFCCPQCSMASARTEFDSSNCIFNCLCVSGPVAYNIVREGYGIEGDCCSDILIGGCFPCCAAMRVSSEVHTRGPVKKGMH